MNQEIEQTTQEKTKGTLTAGVLLLQHINPNSNINFINVFKYPDYTGCGDKYYYTLGHAEYGFHGKVSEHWRVTYVDNGETMIPSMGYKNVASELDGSIAEVIRDCYKSGLYMMEDKKLINNSKINKKIKY